MAIKFEHVNRLKLHFRLLWQRSKCSGCPFISYSDISYFRTAYPHLNVVLISRLTGECATQIKKNTCAILIDGYIMDISRSKNENTDFFT